MIGIRQVALLSEDLDVDAQSAEVALNTHIVHSDPTMAQFGLRNAVLPLGSGYLELVTPIDPTSSAARRLATRGPGFYMLIVQMDPPMSKHRERIHADDIRILAEFSDDGWSSIQLHPGDSLATMLSLDVVENIRGAVWPPVGEHRPALGCHAARIAGVVIDSEQPQTLIRRWRRIFGVHEAAGAAISLGESIISFRCTPGNATVSEVQLRSDDGPRGGFALCGTKFTYISDGEQTQ